MRISINWLKDILPTQVGAQEIADRLSVSGLEVEHLEEWQSLTGGLKGFVIGEVLTCEQHPNADKLKLTTVNIGSGEPLNIVCVICSTSLTSGNSKSCGCNGWNRNPH